MYTDENSSKYKFLIRQIKNERGVQMGTVTTSVRVDEDKLVDFKDVQAQFESGKEFAEWIIQSYRMYESSKVSDLFTQDTQALATMFSSILGTMNGIISRAEGIVQSKDANIQENLRIKDEKQEELQEEINILREEISAKNEEIKSQKQLTKEVQDQLKETQDILSKVEKELSTVHKLNELLEQEKDQYQAIATQNEQLVEEVSILRASLTETKSEKDKAIHKVNELEKDNASLVEKYNDKLATLEHTHKQALEHAEQMKDIAVTKAIVETQKEAQAEIKQYMRIEQELRDKVNSIREEKALQGKEMEETIHKLNENEKAYIHHISELEKQLQELQMK